MLQKERNSSIELLRILAMLFIICSHLCVHNGLSLSSLPLSVNKILMQCGVLGNLGVDIFVIITGYFVCEKTFSLKRVCSLLTQVWFYSLLASGVSVFAFGVKPTLLEIEKTFFPTVFAEYWFFTAYIVLLLLSPFINLAIKQLDRAAFSRLLAIVLVLWVVIPTVTAKQMYGAELPQLALCYLIGAYFRKFPENRFSQKRARIFLTVASFCLMYAFVLLFSFITPSSELLRIYTASHFLSRNSLFVVGAAVGLFSLFAYKKPFYNKGVNAVASCTFGVYLLHDHMLFRTVLWRRLFSIATLYRSPLFPLYAVGIIALVFVGCVLVEWVRQKTVARPLSLALYTLLTRIGRLFQKRQASPPYNQ